MLLELSTLMLAMSIRMQGRSGLKARASGSLRRVLTSTTTEMMMMMMMMMMKKVAVDHGENGCGEVVLFPWTATTATTTTTATTKNHAGILEICRGLTGVCCWKLTM